MIVDMRTTWGAYVWAWMFDLIDENTGNKIERCVFRWDTRTGEYWRYDENEQGHKFQDPENPDQAKFSKGRRPAHVVLADDWLKTFLLGMFLKLPRYYLRRAMQPLKDRYHRRRLKQLGLL